MCDTACAIQAERALFAKNSDRPVREPQVVEAHPRRAAGGTLDTTYLTVADAGAHAVIGSRPEWMWGFEHGVNEWGVAIGNEEIWTVDDPAAAPAGLTGMDLVRLGLERARTADDALDAMVGLLDEYGQGGVGNREAGEAYFSSFLIVDARTGWVLETSDRTWAARRVGTGAAISNRITIGTEWERASADVASGADFDAWRSAHMWTGHADVRLAANRAAIVERAATVEPADLAAALRDHGTGPWGRPGSTSAAVPPPGRAFDPQTGDGVTVCMHLRDYQATTSAIVAALPVDEGGPVRVWVALGNPCASIFVPGFLPSAVPPAFGEVATARRFADVSRSVEATHGGARLEHVRAVLDPLEADLWQEADALVSRGDSSDTHASTRFAADAWSRVDAALAALGA